MAQVYKVTNTKNQKIYIGISVASDGSALLRFAKHLAGEGGVWIKRDLESGITNPDDFEIEILEESDNVEYIADKEIYYIEHFNSLYPNGYNGNKGNYIVNTPETMAKAQETRAKNKAAGKVYGIKGIHAGHAVYRYPDGPTKSLPITHPDVISGVVTHVNFDPNSAAQIKKREHEEQCIRNNGLTDKELLRRELLSQLWKYVHTTEWWKKGREKFRERMSRKEFTDAEKELYFERRPEIVKANWAKMTPEEKLKKYGPGMRARNSRKICPHCGIETNLGNFSRWHGDKCKKVPKDDNI